VRRIGLSLILVVFVVVIARPVYASLECEMIYLDPNSTNPSERTKEITVSWSTDDKHRHEILTSTLHLIVPEQVAILDFLDIFMESTIEQFMKYSNNGNVIDGDIDMLIREALQSSDAIDQKLPYLHRHALVQSQAIDLTGLSNPSDGSFIEAVRQLAYSQVVRVRDYNPIVVDSEKTGLSIFLNGAYRHPADFSRMGRSLGYAVVQSFVLDGSMDRIEFDTISGNGYSSVDTVGSGSDAIRFLDRASDSIESSTFLLVNDDAGWLVVITYPEWDGRYRSQVGMPNTAVMGKTWNEDFSSNDNTDKICHILMYLDKQIYVWNSDNRETGYDTSGSPSYIPNSIIYYVGEVESIRQGTSDTFVYVDGGVIARGGFDNIRLFHHKDDSGWTMGRLQLAFGCRDYFDFIWSVENSVAELNDSLILTYKSMAAENENFNLSGFNDESSRLDDHYVANSVAMVPTDLWRATEFTLPMVNIWTSCLGAADRTGWCAEQPAVVRVPEPAAIVLFSFSVAFIARWIKKSYRHGKKSLL